MHAHSTYVQQHGGVRSDSAGRDPVRVRRLYRLGLDPRGVALSQVRPQQAVDAGQDIKYYVLYLTALGCDGQIVLDNQYLLTEMKTTVVSVRACGGLPSSSSRSAAPAGYIRAV